MALEDHSLAAEGAQALGHGEAVGAGFQDEDILAGGVTGSPRAERFQRLARDALSDARTERIASLQDGGREGIGVDVEADGAARGAECRRGGIGGLLWWRVVHSFGLW